jgi:hypothetical protein
MQIADLVDGLHLVHGVRRLLRRPVTLEEARATVERRPAHTTATGKILHVHQLA